MKDSILVVDDNQYERSLVTRALAKLSATCVLRQAASAEEALDAVKEQPPSVALMDCRLPGISGIEALRQLRASGHGFPIIMCTAEDARDSVIEALRAGASDYLVKDKNFFEMLPIAVDKALGLHRLEQEKATILERLRQGKDRYERLVIHAHDIMFQVDSKGRFLYVNPALEGDLGHRPEELYDDPELACRLVHPEDRERARAVWTRLLESGGEETLELRVVSGGLRMRWYELQLFSARTASGHVLQGIARNVTESRELAHQLKREKSQLEQANAQLLEVNRLKSEFVASVSHELRTPMNSIIGYTDCLLDGLDGPLTQDQLQSLARVRKNAGQLLNLLNDILDTAKIESGRMTVSPEEFDLCELGKEVMAVAKPLLRDANVVLTSDFPQSLPVKADYDKVRRTLVNLISNAIKFTERGQVKLSVRRLSSIRGSVKIEVEDSGIGIKSEELPHIFDDFRQATGSQRGKFGGTGLGLSITRKLVELHGGQIWAKSEPAVGSTFHVVLPILPEESESSEEPSELHEADAAEARHRHVVLVVDRQTDILQMVKKVLVAEGYRVVGASDADEGMRFCRELRPFAVLLDPGLTRSNGRLLIESIKGDTNLRKTPVLVMLPELDSTTVISLGAAEGLKKPLDIKELIRKVQALEGGGHQPSILLVDDEEDTLQLLQDMMRIAGYTDIRTTRDGKKALEEIERRKPDLMLVEVSMPVLDGFEVISRVRRQPALSELPIIVVTGKSLTEQERTFLQGHVRKVVQKKSLEQAMLATGLRSLLSAGGGE